MPVIIMILSMMLLALVNLRCNFVELLFEITNDSSLPLSFDLLLSCLEVDEPKTNVSVPDLVCDTLQSFLDLLLRVNVVIILAILRGSFFIFG